MAAPLGYPGDQLATFRLIQQRSIASGRPSAITALGYSGGQLTTLREFAEGWTLGEMESDGRRLAPEVQFELWITDAQIDQLNGQLVSAWQYDGVIYQILKPSPYKPTGADIFWRFWLSPQENDS